MPHAKGTKLGLKPKSKAVLDLIAGNPKMSYNEAYRRVHKSANKNTVSSNVYKLLRKPEAQIYLDKHVNNARRSIVSLSQSAKNENVRLNASQDILDREYGKATQRTENTNTTVTLSLDLTAITSE